MPPPLRHVIVHTPGPAWKPGVPPFEQDGLPAHVQHFAAWLAAGKLAFGGPFMDERSGGMMIAADGVTRDEAERFAADDPAVRSGLLVAEVRPWAPALQAKERG